jgi:DNA-3-methyladenine glycosylase I
LAGFDYHQVAKFGDQELTRLMNDAGIVRNRLKLVAIINNAQKFIEVQKEFGSFAKYMWGFVNNKAIQSEITNAQQMPVVTKEAESFAKDLKARGFKFLGPTVVYAHMQALGMVNDHLVSCVRYKELQYQTSHA